MKNLFGKFSKTRAAMLAFALLAAATAGVPAFAAPGGPNPRERERTPARRSPTPAPATPHHGARVIVTPRPVVVPARDYLLDDLKIAMYAEVIDLAEIELILRSGIVPDSECMIFAVRNNRADLLELFLLAGGDPNAPFAPGMPLLGAAHCVNGDTACAKLLIDFGARTEFVAGFADGRCAFGLHLRSRGATELIAYIRGVPERPHRKAGFPAKTVVVEKNVVVEKEKSTETKTDDAAEKTQNAEVAKAEAEAAKAKAEAEKAAAESAEKSE